MSTSNRLGNRLESIVMKEINQPTIDLSDKLGSFKNHPRRKLNK